MRRLESTVKGYLDAINASEIRLHENLNIYLDLGMDEVEEAEGSSALDQVEDHGALNIPDGPVGCEDMVHGRGLLHAESQPESILPIPRSPEEPESQHAFLNAAFDWDDGLVDQDISGDRQGVEEGPEALEYEVDSTAACHPPVPLRDAFGSPITNAVPQVPRSTLPLPAPPLDGLSGGTLAPEGSSGGDGSLQPALPDTPQTATTNAVRPLPPLITPSEETPCRYLIKQLIPATPATHNIDLDQSDGIYTARGAGHSHGKDATDPTDLRHASRMSGMGAMAINPELCAAYADIVPHLCPSPEISSPVDRSSGGGSRRRHRPRQPLRRSPEAFGAGPSPPAVFHSRDELQGISVLVATPASTAATASAATPESTHSIAPLSPSRAASAMQQGVRSVQVQGPSLLQGTVKPRQAFVASSPEELREAGIETDDAMVAVAFPAMMAHRSQASAAVSHSYIVAPHSLYFV